MAKQTNYSQAILDRSKLFLLIIRKNLESQRLNFGVSESLSTFRAIALQSKLDCIIGET